MFGNQIWCAVRVSNITDTDHETQRACASNEADSEDAQASTPEDSERKECPETVTSEEQSSLSEEVRGKKRGQRSWGVG